MVTVFELLRRVDHKVKVAVSGSPFRVLFPKELMSMRDVEMLVPDIMVIAKSCPVVCSSIQNVRKVLQANKRCNVSLAFRLICIIR